MTRPIAVPANGRTRPHKVPSNFADEASVRRAMLAKLQESALTAKDAEALGVQPFTAAQVQSRLGQLAFHRAGFQIPYHNVHGKPTAFFRFRYLEYDNGHGFGKLAHTTNGNGLPKPNDGDIRYVQMPGTLPEVYFPLNTKDSWRAILANSNIPLVITEGELKAACACKHGLYCLGLGGVWSWKSKKEGMHLLPVFQEIVMKTVEGDKTTHRQVIIVFDSDSVTNTNVHKAENALAHELTQLGAQVFIMRMPALDGQKTGLDDYLAKTKDYALEGIPQEPWTEAKELFKLNEEVLYVCNPGLVIRVDDGQRMAPSAFGEHHYANRLWHTVNAAGNPVEKQAAKEWLKWPHRAEVPRLTYRPGQPRITAQREFNTWEGWGCEPEKGDVSIWLEAMEYLFADHEDAAARRLWFQQWLGYPLEHPGTKLNQAVLMWSVLQGPGKSMIGYAMQSIYGKNCTEIGNRQLEGNFNEWAENKQFVIGDEISCDPKRKRDVGDRIKSMITQKELRINTKYVPSYVVPDCINYYFTSNHADALAISATDRRFFINEIKRPPLPASFYKRFHELYVRSEGHPTHGSDAGTLMYYLMHLDKKGYEPNGHAPVTDSKIAMQAANLLGPNEQFAYDLRYNRAAMDNSHARALGRVLFTPKDLKDWGNSGKTEEELKHEPHVDGQLWKALRAQGFSQAYRGQPVNGVFKGLWGSKAPDRLWIITADRAVAAQYEAITDGKLLKWIYLIENGFRPTGEPPIFPDWYTPQTKHQGAQ